jgi:HK97 gp10 family phage protein
MFSVMPFKLEISVDSKEVQSVINQIMNAVSESVNASLLQAGEEIVSEAQRVVPVKTGYLRSTIGILESGPNSITVGATAPYSAFVELGTRFMRPRPYLSPAVNHMVASRLQDIIIEQFNRRF